MSQSLRDLLAYHRKQTVAVNAAATVSLERLALPSTSGKLLAVVPTNGSSTQYYTVEGASVEWLR
jgi:hypothetical protein